MPVDVEAILTVTFLISSYRAVTVNAGLGSVVYINSRCFGFLSKFLCNKNKLFYILFIPFPIFLK